MKFAKYFIASFMLLAIASAFIIPKGHAKRFTTTYYVYTQSGNDFTIGTGTDARLQDTLNWTVQSSAPSSCSGTNKICYFTITYTVTAPNTTPTEQQILDAMATKYNDGNSPNNSFSFDGTNPDYFTISNVGGTGTSVTYTLTQKG